MSLVHDALVGLRRSFVTRNAKYVDLDVHESSTVDPPAFARAGAPCTCSERP